MMPAPRFAPSFPTPRFASQPAPRPMMAGPGHPQPAFVPSQPAGPALAQQPVPSVIRAQGADEPAPPPQGITPPRSLAPAAAAVLADSRPVPLSIPSPEQLGVTCARPVSGDTDWTAVHRRLDRLGATCFQMQKVAGGCRFVCLLPTDQPGRTHRVEAQAATEAEAVRLGLDQAEAWARQR